MIAPTTTTSPAQQAIRQIVKKVVNPHADIVNAQFTHSKSQYVNLKQRIDASLAANSWHLPRYNFAQNTWRSTYPGIKSFKQIRLCKAVLATLDMIDIDVTLQRVVNFPHLCWILANFKQLLVMPICVYEDKTHPGRYVCWDGQHTVLVLYIIACVILGHDPATVEVPIVMYDSNLKSEMRESFLELNGDAKKPLDPIDQFHQYLFGVRTDNAQNDKWLAAERKQVHLETHGMFATHEKFGDQTQPGALSNLTEFMELDESWVEVVCKYFFHVCNSNRAVDTKEFWMMSMYFKLAQSQGIAPTDTFIKEVCTSLNAAFGGNYDPDALYNQAQIAYEEWWRINKPMPDGTLLGINRHRKNDTITFLAAQIAKYIKPGVSVPNTNAQYNRWQVDPTYLF
jgi:hypothetical protein